MIYRHKDGDRLRVGLGYDFKPLSLALALPTSLGPNPHLAWISVCFTGAHRSFAFSIDWYRDHAMYRPNDCDSGTHLECRRCGARSSEPTSNYCGGFLMTRHRWDKFVFRVHRPYKALKENP